MLGVQETMISRRSFLKIAAAAGIVLVTPVQLAALAPIQARLSGRKSYSILAF